MTKYTLDAQGKRIGRVTSEAASLLMGKKTVSFVRNKAPDIQVEIVNASKAWIDEKKGQNKKYVSYSGYPGGIKEETLAHLSGRRGAGEIFKNAVNGMLPKNKLRNQMMKNLTIIE